MLARIGEVVAEGGGRIRVRWCGGGESWEEPDRLFVASADDEGYHVGLCHRHAAQNNQIASVLFRGPLFGVHPIYPTVETSLFELWEAHGILFQFIIIHIGCRLGLCQLDAGSASHAAPAAFWTAGGGRYLNRSVTKQKISW